MNEVVVAIPNGTLRYDAPPQPIESVWICDKLGEEVARFQIPEESRVAMTAVFTYLAFGIKRETKEVPDPIRLGFNTGPRMRLI